MPQILQCRKYNSKRLITKLTDIRNKNIHPGELKVKAMDVLDDIIEKGFQHPSIVKELQNHDGK
jgi:hypothetical protein